MNTLPSSASGTHAERVFQRLHDDIVRCRLAPGAKLNIVEISKSYGIGATPLREALSRLAATGLVVAHGNRGFRVGSLSIDDLMDLTKTRMWVEEIALRASIANGDLNWESEIVACGHKLGLSTANTDRPKLGLDESWEGQHFQFHASLVSACGSSYLLDYWESLFIAASRYRRWNLINFPNERDGTDEHRAIMNAVLERDADKAVGLMLDHISKMVRMVLTVDPSTVAYADAYVDQLWRDMKKAKRSGVPTTKESGD